MLEGHTDSVVAVAISTDGAKIVSGSGDKTVRVWSMETGEVQPASQPSCMLDADHCKKPVDQLTDRIVDWRERFTVCAAELVNCTHRRLTAAAAVAIVTANSCGAALGCAAPALLGTWRAACGRTRARLISLLELHKPELS